MWFTDFISINVRADMQDIKFECFPDQVLVTVFDLPPTPEEEERDKIIVHAITRAAIKSYYYETDGDDPTFAQLIELCDKVREDMVNTYHETMVTYIQEQQKKEQEAAEQ